MTKSLIVNCSFSGKINLQLLSAIGIFSQYTILDFGQINQSYFVPKKFDALVLSGSAARIVNIQDRAKFKGVERLIKSSNVPIFGICFGHQLLCWAFGAEVGSLPHQVDNQFEAVQIIETCDIFDGFKEGQTIPLSENHYDYILKDSLDKAGFVLLANSGSCEVEAVRHKTKPFYGVQFHPERITINEETHLEGHKVIANFYRNVVKR